MERGRLKGITSLNWIERGELGGFLGNFVPGVVYLLLGEQFWMVELYLGLPNY